jgi:hypothetical protein
MDEVARIGEMRNAYRVLEIQMLSTHIPHLCFDIALLSVFILLFPDKTHCASFL